jgi:hypothetical protein
LGTSACFEESQISSISELSLRPCKSDRSRIFVPKKYYT